MQTFNSDGIRFLNTEKATQKGGFNNISEVRE